MPHLDRPTCSSLQAGWRPRASPRGLLAALLLAALALQPAQALDLASLKTAIVYNLLLFAEWPPEVLAADGSALTLCIDAAGSAIDPMLSLAARPVGSHKLEVRGVNAAPESMRGCHAWYRDAAVPAPGFALRHQLQQGAVLTISNDIRRDDDATAIYLVELNGRLSFDVDAVTVKQHRLQLSSKLLRLARKVYE
ncbi:MAG TPA: YfiR family protein [Ideonella sp.]|nr:YfiR family protein [Ideonella sp.]